MEHLSHYTSAKVAPDVVRSGSLWLSEFVGLNDPSELNYAFSALVCDAIARVYARIPAELKAENTELPTLEQVTSQIRNEFVRIGSSDGGYGVPYIMSFALSTSALERDDGILTMWRLYAEECRGYCLQFAVSDIRGLLEHELNRYSYDYLDIVPVSYGLDKSSPEYLALVQQLDHRLSQIVYNIYRDGRIFDRDCIRWFESKFNVELLKFCARHKHSAYKDEREVRIVAVPNARVQLGWLSGPLLTKKVRMQTNGKRYIILAENRLDDSGDLLGSRISPRAILCGPLSDGNTSRGFETLGFRGSVRKSTIPFKV